MKTTIAPTGANTLRRWLLPLLAGLFFLSGISGLIYQSLWLRLLSMVFGVTVYAASTVLASFMAGLALGTLGAGHLSTWIRRPLVWFGIAEIGIGAIALLTPWALGFVSHIWIAMEPWVPDQLWALTLARFVCSLAVLLAPTALMGATLPLVVRSSLAECDLVGPRVAVLYAANTAGAIVGTLAAGFVLIGGIGIQRSFYLAAALNGVVGLSVLALSMKDVRRPAPATPALDVMAAPPIAVSRLGLAVFAFSGFAALALEVVWFRVLVLVVSATSYAFTTMLAAVLFGIAAGSALATPLLGRSWNWIRAFGVVQIATGLLTICAMGLYLHAYAAGWLRGSDHVASLFIIVPPALGMGLAFPVGIRAWAESADHASGARAASVAKLYAANVAGAILGAAASGFVLVPVFGSRISVGLLAGGYVVSGLMLAWRGSSGKRLTSFAVSVILLGGFGWLAAGVPSPFAAVEGRRVPPSERPMFLEEGVQTTVGVYGRPMGGYVLYLNGLHQADDSAPMVQVHRQIGLLPAAIHPAPRRALVIGLGGGVTAGALSLVDGLTLDVVELSDSVVRAARWFRHANEDVLNRPNVRLRVDDGRNYLLSTRGRYDIVTADIIQPIHAGAGLLYSAEYFRLAKRVLAPGGIMLQWIGSRPVSQYNLIARTFLDVFPHATAWAGGTLLVGSAEPLRLDPAAFLTKSLQPGTRSGLALVDLATFDALLGHYTAGPDQLRAFVGPGPILTDDRPLVEFHRSLPGNEKDIDTSGLRDDPTRWIVRLPEVPRAR